MLLEFELENDGAFATASAISMVATKLRGDVAGRVVSVGDPGETLALTSALILGKNGSGKSTLVGAMQFVARFVRTSANDSSLGDEIDFEPNLLVKGLELTPTRYRVVFSMHGTIYEFEFSHDNQRVITESLQVADKSVRFRKMYDRRWVPDAASYEYSFGDALTGRRTIWQESTRDNALFISTAAGLNSASIKPAFEWLSQFMRSTSVSAHVAGDFTARQCSESPDFTRRVVNFLQALDINVEEIHIEEEQVDQKILSSTFSTEFLEFVNKMATDRNALEVRRRIYFDKKDDSGSLVRLPFEKESTGTRALFHLSGPLFDSLDNGYCLLVDEINTSLHPIIVSFLIDLFGNDEINQKRAQLLFTSHDTSVLSGHRMRRDQVWIIDNQGIGAHLVPLSDFSPRHKEALDRGYLGGRYGGVPVVTPALVASDFCKRG